MGSYNNAVNALKEILALAEKNNTMYYSELMRKNSLNRAHIGKVLYVIDALCRRLHLPRINLLIVLKQTGLPSDLCEIYYGNFDNFLITVSRIDWKKEAPRLQTELQLMITEREKRN